MPDLAVTAAVARLRRAAGDLPPIAGVTVLAGDLATVLALIGNNEQEKPGKSNKTEEKLKAESR